MALIMTCARDGNTTVRRAGQDRARALQLRGETPLSDEWLRAHTAPVRCKSGRDRPINVNRQPRRDCTKPKGRDIPMPVYFTSRAVPLRISRRIPGAFA